MGDGPRLGVGWTEGLDDLLIEAGISFTLKPNVPIRDAMLNAPFGDEVLVAEIIAMWLPSGKQEKPPLVL